MTTVDQLIYTRAVTLSQGTNLNDVHDAGFYQGLGLGNAPHGGFWYVEVMRATDDASYVTQRLTELAPANGVSTVYIRTCIGGNWGPLTQQGAQGPQGPAGPPGSGGGGGGGSNGFAVYNILDFGAQPSGDATAAFQAAFNALNSNPMGGVIYIPPGEYVISSQIGGATDKNFIVRGSGAASRLIISGGMANGLVMQQLTPNNALELCDLRILATNCPNLGNGSIVSVIGVLQGCDGVRVDNIHFQVTDDAPCSNVLYICNPSSGVVRDVNIDGYSGWGESNSATGIYIICDTQGANAIQLINCNIFRVYTGIRCVGGQIHAYVMEGFEANECTIVGCQFGLVMQGGWYRVPGNGWRGGHINCRQICIQLDSWMEFKISDALLYLDGSAAANSQGFIKATNCEDINVHNCTTRYVDEITGGPTQRGIWGMALLNSQNCLIQGNFFDIGRADSAAIYAVPGTGCANVRSAFNTKRGGGAALAGDVRSIGEDIVV